MQSHHGYIAFLCVVLSVPRADAAGRSSNNRSMMKLFQQMQMQQMQQMQAVRQARIAQREEHMRVVREAAQRERERKEAALHKSGGGSFTQLGSGKKDDKPHSEMASSSDLASKNTKNVGDKSGPWWLTGR